MSNIIVTFGKALTNHALDGFNKRSKDQILYILNTYCSGCEFYRNEHCMHSTCGCNVNGKETFLNKLAWSSEKCPIGKWPSGQIPVPSGSGV